MSMRRRPKEAQPEMWIATSDLRSPGHPFYDRVDTILREAKFDSFVEDRFERFYVKGKGRPGIAPGVYMRLMLVGYFEGISSERSIAWRCADSLSLRTFLGLAMSESVPDHSSLSRIRTRVDVETHQEAFDFILAILAEKGLVRGRTIGVDATTARRKTSTSPPSRRSRASRHRRARTSRSSTRSARKLARTTTGRTRTIRTPRSRR